MAGRRPDSDSKQSSRRSIPSTVKVVQKEAGMPVEDAQVRLGVYFAYSDSKGIAKVAMPPGTYSLDVLKTGFEASSRVLDVCDDVTVEVEVVVVPPENPDASWLGESDETDLAD